MSEDRVEWSVMDDVGNLCREGPWSSREEAEAYCRAHVVTYERVMTSPEVSSGLSFMNFPAADRRSVPPRVVSRRVTEWA